MGGGALGAGPYAHARGEDAVVHAFCLCHRVQLVHLLSPGQLPRQSRAWVCGCVGVCTRVSGWHMEGGGASHLVEHRAQPIVQLPEARGQLLVRRGLRRRHEQTQKAEAVPAFVVATYLSFSSEDIGRYLCLLQNFDEDGSHSLLRAMAKSIRSKVKKRLRSVKRGVLKKDLQVCCGCPRTHTRTRAHTTPRFESPRRSTISRQPPLASALHLLLSLSLSWTGPRNQGG